MTIAETKRPVGRPTTTEIVLTELQRACFQEALSIVDRNPALIDRLPTLFLEAMGRDTPKSLIVRNFSGYVEDLEERGWLEKALTPAIVAQVLERQLAQGDVFECGKTICRLNGHEVLLSSVSSELASDIVRDFLKHHLFGAALDFCDKLAKANPNALLYIPVAIHDAVDLFVASGNAKSASSTLLAFTVGHPEDPDEFFIHESLDEKRARVQRIDDVLGAIHKRLGLEVSEPFLRLIGTDRLKQILINDVALNRLGGFFGVSGQIGEARGLKGDIPAMIAAGVKQRFAKGGLDYNGAADYARFLNSPSMRGPFAAIAHNVAAEVGVFMRLREDATPPAQTYNVAYDALRVDAQGNVKAYSSDEDGRRIESLVAGWNWRKQQAINETTQQRSISLRSLNEAFRFVPHEDPKSAAAKIKAKAKKEIEGFMAAKREAAEHDFDRRIERMTSLLDYAAKHPYATEPVRNILVAAQDALQAQLAALKPA